MRGKIRFALLAFTLLLGASVFPQSAGPAPEYTADGQLRLPENYREWIFLSSGFDMSYDAKPRDRHMFDNVFVNPEAFLSFQKTGTWPDRTVFILELRSAGGKGSINQAGSFQDTSVVAIEAHVKDEAHLPGKWGFFSFGANGKKAKLIAQTQDCYSCHAQHGAVDTTFVQFYPTLLPIAKAKGTLASGYQNETNRNQAAGSQ